ncbi:MAG: YdcF family protein [Piscinibacter sp.]
MNDLLALLGLSAWKHVIDAMLLPPVPFILLMLVGTRLVLVRRGLGWLVVLFGATLLWLSSTTGTARLLSDLALRPPGALSSDRIDAWKAAVKAREPVAIVVLGGGAKRLSPEYGVSNLRENSVERLRYGVHLGRETGAPVAFSGGVAWGVEPGTMPSEAQIAARIASQEFGRPLKWTEERSRDTRENAAYTVALLKEQGIRRVLLVTHQRHMPRSLRAFEQAAQGSGIVFEPAPVDVLTTSLATSRSWLPSTAGLVTTRELLHELFGRWLGA